MVYSSAEKSNPSGARIFSWTTLLAASPPRSSAIAPTMAYKDVIRTDSIPDPWRLSACDCVSIVLPHPVKKMYVPSSASTVLLYRARIALLFAPTVPCRGSCSVPRLTVLAVRSTQGAGTVSGQTRLSLPVLLAGSL